MVRQHVNPLSRFFQLPRPLPPPAELFSQPDLPLHLDIGCARGRFLLALAQHQPNCNYLGVEIRRPLVDAAEADRQALGLGNLHYLFCNANISLQDWLVALPAGLLQRVTIQFPDPWFKQKHQKRRVLQPALLLALAEALGPGRELFIQSDVLAVITPMVQLIEASGGFDRPAAVGHHLRHCRHGVRRLRSPGRRWAPLACQQPPGGANRARNLRAEPGVAGLPGALPTQRPQPGRPDQPGRSA